MTARALLVIGLALIWSVSACTDTELPVQPKAVGSARFGIVAPNLAPTDFPLGSSQDPYKTMSLPSYSNATIVEVMLTGTTRVTSLPNTQVQAYSGPFDGSGIFVYGAWNACYANVSFLWPASQQSGPSPCLGPPDSTRLKSVWADTILASGAGTVTRWHGVPQWTGDCNNTPCHSYSYIGGMPQVSVTPVPASLGLGLNPDSVIAGLQVSFYAGKNPLYIKNIPVPLTVLSWQWTPDGGGSGQTVACAQPVNPCRTYVKEAGSMQLTALVNGTEQSKSVSVGIMPLAAACPAAVLRNSPVTTDEFGNVDATHHYEPHVGRDSQASLNTPIYSARSGIIREIVYSTSTGWRIIVESTDGSGPGGSNRYSFYYHLNSKPVAPIAKGHSVTAGDFLGNTGSTGESTGPHLHFEEHSTDQGIWNQATKKAYRSTLVQPCTF